MTIWDCRTHVRMTSMTSSVEWTDLDFKISVALSCIIIYLPPKKLSKAMYLHSCQKTFKGNVSTQLFHNIPPKKTITGNVPTQLYHNIPPKKLSKAMSIHNSIIIYLPKTAVKKLLKAMYLHSCQKTIKGNVSTQLYHNIPPKKLLKAMYLHSCIIIYLPKNY